MRGAALALALVAGPGAAEVGALYGESCAICPSGKETALGLGNLAIVPGSSGGAALSHRASVQADGRERFRDR